MVPAGKALAFLGCLLGALPAPAGARQTIILVRHAEKADTTRDAVLSPAGERRAQALADALAYAGVTAIYTTQFRRTRATAAPLALQLGITPTVIEVQGAAAANAQAVVAAIRSSPETAVILVVGHRNTIPLMIQELGGAAPELLGDNDYGDLFILTLRSGGPTQTIRARFGASDSVALNARGPAGPSGTEIYLARLSMVGTRLHVGPFFDITNRPGYDNQPSFAPDGRSLLYTSIREDAQADTYRYDIAAASTERVTHTTESEYSPTYVPQGDGFSVVRVESDSTQRLWRFSSSGADPQLVVETVKPVGYYAWGDDHVVVLYVLGSPATLQLADLATGQVRVAATDIGRSLHRVPGHHAVSYLQHQEGEDWTIEELDLSSGAARPLVRALDGSQDYAWMPDGSMLMAQGTVLYRWSGPGASWTEVTDLATAGVGRVTRLAVSAKGDWLAFVADEPGP